MQTEQKLTSVSDPNHVDITLANGPTQLSMINGLFILTLSQVRPVEEANRVSTYWPDSRIGYARRAFAQWRRSPSI
jgi:hypothetical protein